LVHAKISNARGQVVLTKANAIKLVPLPASGLFDGLQHVRLRTAIAGKSLWLSLVLIGMTLASLAIGVGIDGLFGAFLAQLMIAIAIIDSRRYIIPNELTAAALVLALLRANTAFAGMEANPVLIALLKVGATVSVFLLFTTAYRYVRGREGLGLGDVKLAAMAAAWLDWSMLLVAIEGAALTALVFYAGRQWLYGRRVNVKARLPFGAFLAPFIWIGWLLEALAY
jgi:leader peptidase (prepilin peptidase)/N-methyltransferase